MWIALIVIASLLLAVTAVAPKGEVEDARWSGLGDNAFPTSKYGDVVPDIYGTCEQKAPIVLWFGKFQPLANYVEQRTGLFSSTQVVESYRYLIGFDLGICLGPSVVLEQIKKEGGAIVWDGRSGGEVGGSGPWANISIQGFLDIGGGLEFFSGNFNQIPSPFISTPSTQSGGHFQSGAAVENYSAMPGICHCVFVQFYIGDDNPVPPRFTFVVKDLANNLGGAYNTMPNNQDTNPMEIVYTILTKKHGCLGIDPSMIDVPNFQAAAHTLHTEGLGMSMIVSKEQEAKKVIEECMRVADGILYQDPADEKFRVKLIRNDYDINTILVLDESNILSSGLEGFGRTTWENTFNQVRVKYQSRANNYQSQVVLAQDHGNIRYTGAIRSTTVTFPGVKDDEVARFLASRELELLSSPLMKFSLKTNREAKDLRPGDVLKMNWAPYGLINAVMRVVKINFGTLTDNKISIDLVQDKYAAGLESFKFPVETAHINIDLGAPETTEFLVYDPPLFLVIEEDNISEDFLEQFEVQYKPMILAKAPSEHCVGFDAHVAHEAAPNKYKTIMTNQPYIGVGKLESKWDSDDADNGCWTGQTAIAGLIVYDMTDEEIDSLVDNADLAEARDGSSLFRIGSETFCYVGFTKLGDGRVQFDNLYRGMLETRIANDFINYAAESKVYFIRRGSGVSATFFYPITADEIYFKIASKTPIGSLDINTISPFTKDLLVGEQRKPLPPKGLKFDGNLRTEFAPFFSNSFTLSWLPRSRRDAKLYHWNESYDPVYAEVDIRYRISLSGYDEGVWAVVIQDTTNSSYTLNVSGFDNSQNLIGVLYTIKKNQSLQDVFSVPVTFNIST